MIAYIDTYRDQFGVELICRTLGATERGFITSRGYRAAKTRPASDRALRDRALLPQIRKVLGDRNRTQGGSREQAVLVEMRGDQCETTRRLLAPGRAGPGCRFLGLSATLP